MQLSTRPAEVTVFGQLVHNPVVMRELSGRGFRLLSEQMRRTEDVATEHRSPQRPRGEDHERQNTGMNGAHTRGS